MGEIRFTLGGLKEILSGAMYHANVTYLPASQPTTDCAAGYAAPTVTMTATSQPSSETQAPASAQYTSCGSTTAAGLSEDQSPSVPLTATAKQPLLPSELDNTSEQHASEQQHHQPSSPSSLPDLSSLLASGRLALPMSMVLELLGTCSSVQHMCRVGRDV